MISSIKISQHISIQSELKPFSNEEKNILRKIKQKKNKFFFSSLSGFLLLIPAGWFLSVNRESWLIQSRLSDEYIERIILMRPYFFLLISLSIASYFIYYYYKLLYPLTKDLKQGMKEILYYDPGKYKTPFFEEFYIVTPILKKTRVKISKDFFDAIDDNNLAAISYSLYSHFIFSIELNDRKIIFNETSEPIDT